ncbi:MAG: glycine--tRNA ligase [Patescibacteria group bacterium]|nr:glycine--tRNA ligase [Patescibacteria group bacterium]MDD5164701.1 glycine--tRNA ligase [Patescibacteria group bacterium]MDD5534177.1 glycine--tRNA ligase [Patescibacteria group bacterium]
MAKELTKMDKIISLCKRRGFIFPGSEIYGGLANSWDFGPLGVELKNNIKRTWWKEIVQKRDDVVGLDSSILTPKIVWEASGHLENFTDPLVECKKCHQRFRSDKIEGKKCPDCGGELTEGKKFNLLMKTHLGAVEGSQDEAYMRGETCQGIYLNYLNVKESMRKKLPFGVAQVGKAFRNEITPGNFIFRTREFEQMEMQYFVSPKEANEYYQEWKDWTFDWYKNLVYRPENLRLRQHEKDELAHYAKEAWDVEYKTPFDDWSEFAGIHNRGDWDLSRHGKYSGVDMNYTNEETKEKFIPYVDEVSMGADRAVLLFLIDAYDEVETRSGGENAVHETEIVLRLHKNLAPIKVAILPLSKKEELSQPAKEIYHDLQKYFMCQYDETASIGKRYRRQDEIGTPYCVTVDFESLEDKKVTVRDRDTMKQERILISELTGWLKDKLEN